MSVETGFAARAARALPFHYGWLVVVAGMLAVFASLGLGRFALGMLLPSMGQSLPLSRSEMGFISTGNFIGYLAAVLLGGRMIARFGERRVIGYGLALVGGSMLAIGRANGFLEILLLYIATGFGSAAANVTTMTLTAHWFGRSLRGRAAGFMVIGSGFAIMLSGAVVPAINAAHGGEGWRLGWAVLAAAVLACSACAFLVLRDRPEQVGLRLVERSDIPAAKAAASERAAAVNGKRVLAHLGVLYFLFGFTYVIYATFIVTALVQERHLPEHIAGQFWTWIGALSLLSGPVFGTLSDRIGRRGGLMLVYAFHTAAYLLVALPLPDVWLYASIVPFGVVAWSVPSIMAAAVGDYLGPAQAATAFGTITFLFAIGQITGPALAGWMADALGTFSASFALAAAMAGLALVSAAFLPKRGS